VTANVQSNLLTRITASSRDFDLRLAFATRRSTASGAVASNANLHPPDASDNRAATAPSIPRRRNLPPLEQATIFNIEASSGASRAAPASPAARCLVRSAGLFSVPGLGRGTNRARRRRHADPRTRPLRVPISEHAVCLPTSISLPTTGLLALVSAHRWVYDKSRWRMSPMVSRPARTAYRRPCFRCFPAYHHSQGWASAAAVDRSHYTQFGARPHVDDAFRRRRELRRVARLRREPR